METTKLVQQARELTIQKNPDFEKAYALLLQAYEAGSAEATYAIATWYLHGQYLKTDFRIGTKYLKKAANQNWPDALYDLAISYEGGLHVKKRVVF